MFRELSLVGQPEERFAYVALTWDAPHRAFFDDRFVSQEDGLPRFVWIDGRDAYADVRPRLGWLGHQALQSALALRSDTAYAAAFATMQWGPEPDATDYAVAEAAVRINATAESIAEASVFRDLFRGYDVVQSKASCSVREGGQTIAKIIPRRNSIFVGIRETKSPQKWFSGPLERVSIHGVEFFGVSVPVEHPDDAQLAVLVGRLVAGSDRVSRERQ